MSVYFGGSRSLPLSSSAVSFVGSVVQAVINQNQAVHVGCQFGADQAVVMVAPPSSLVVFAVAPQIAAPNHVINAHTLGAVVHYSAGGQSAPMPARFLLRSIAAFQGCESAVFFNPGPGSLAVAREFAKTKGRIFAFSEQAPAPIASSRGMWCQSFFLGFQCWQWGYLPEATQPHLF